MAEKQFDLVEKIRQVKRPGNGQLIWMGVGLIAAVGLFIFMQGFVACWRLTALPGIAPATCGGQVTPPVTTPERTPVPGETIVITPTIAAPQAELPPPWDGASRVTVLIIGLDFGDWTADRSGPSRSDTMLLLTIDPITKTAGMLSVPRDMWVNIPGFGYNRINAAYYFGQSYSLPGGGPELARKTVENFLGINIQYYAQVEFTTFEKMIDTIGGVCLDIPREIRVGRTYEHSAVLQPGHQCVDGKSALGYARARDVNQGILNGDVERAEHQQQVILAIRDKVLDPANFLPLVAKANTLYNELSGGINTNLSFNDAMRLAMLAKDIPLTEIQKGVIDYTMMQDGTVNINGHAASILRPYPDKIRDLVETVFGSGSVQPLATGSLEDKMKVEAARVVVINGTGVEGMAARTSEYLKTQGMNVSGVGNTADYPDKYFSPFPGKTIIIVHAGKPYAYQYLKTLVNFSSQNQIVVDFNPDASEDIVLALGSDWNANNPMP